MFLGAKGGGASFTQQVNALLQGGENGWAARLQTALFSCWLKSHKNIWAGNEEASQTIPLPSIHCLSKDPLLPSFALWGALFSV